MSLRAFLVVTLSALVFSGCSARAVDAIDDDAADGGETDQLADGGESPDGSSVDSGTPDSGTPDSGTPDSGTPDSGAPDSGAPCTTTITYGNAWIAPANHVGDSDV